MDLQEFERSKQNRVEHKGELLEIGDRVSGVTIRHPTDGSKNIHNADIIVVSNDKENRIVVGAYQGAEYKIRYSNLGL